VVLVSLPPQKFLRLLEHGVRASGSEVIQTDADLVTMIPFLYEVSEVHYKMRWGAF